jgi:hypothetical protein
MGHKITILALGSRGDVRPFVPLGQALQQCWYHVCIAAFTTCASLIQRAGLAFAAYTGLSISTISPNPLEISTCRSFPGGTDVRPQPRVVAGKLGAMFSASATHKTYSPGVKNKLYLPTASLRAMLMAGSACDR